MTTAHLYVTDRLSLLFSSCDDIQDGMLEFDSFYNGFMAPYFGCYRCVDTKAAFLALDIDKDGLADWEEFKLFLIYALEEHPDRIAELEDLLNIAFIKGILPLMKGLPVKYLLD